jgi:ribosomal-protein-alanine N-acetyltransferase
MPVSPTVRRAGPADLSALVALEQASFSYDRMSPRQFRRHLGNPAAAVLVAEDTSALLGSALLFFRRGATVARLYSLATSAAARGRGIGKALLQAAEDEARRRGAQRLRLEVRRDNAPAVQLYDSRSYRRIAALPAYYDDGADAWRYEKSLISPTPP